MNVIDVSRKINLITDLMFQYRRCQMPRSRLAWRLAQICSPFASRHENPAMMSDPRIGLNPIPLKLLTIYLVIYLRIFN
ncbi:hypothetical protein [Candidatus Nitrotoga sp. BS]|uniref:hypothetical protein n=1 Tax=Candidatus Nitrotoga sp. BS TaxID=2890408 RepID=UPI001EF1DA30|nr:hypothetical protein [Candidatus Nitrotoga sp. BS]